MLCQVLAVNNRHGGLWPEVHQRVRDSLRHAPVGHYPAARNGLGLLDTPVPGGQLRSALGRVRSCDSIGLGEAAAENRGDVGTPHRKQNNRLPPKASIQTQRGNPHCAGGMVRRGPTIGVSYSPSRSRLLTFEVGALERTCALRLVPQAIPLECLIEGHRNRQLGHVERSHSQFS